MRYVNLMSPARGVRGVNGGEEGQRGNWGGGGCRGEGEGAKDGFSCVESMEQD
jgi:hypothetical protein